MNLFGLTKKFSLRTTYLINRNQAEKSVDRRDRSLRASCKHYSWSAVQRPSWACSKPLTSWCSRSLTRRACGKSRPHPTCVFNQQRLLRSMEDAPVKGWKEGEHGAMDVTTSENHSIGKGRCTRQIWNSRKPRQTHVNKSAPRLRPCFSCRLSSSEWSRNTKHKDMTAMFWQQETQTWSLPGTDSDDGRKKESRWSQSRALEGSCFDDTVWWRESSILLWKRKRLFGIILTRRGRR